MKKVLKARKPRAPKKPTKVINWRKPIENYSIYTLKNVTDELLSDHPWADINEIKIFIEVGIESEWECNGVDMSECFYSCEIQNVNYSVDMIKYHKAEAEYQIKLARWNSDPVRMAAAAAKKQKKETADQAKLKKLTKELAELKNRMNHE